MKRQSPRSDGQDRLWVAAALTGDASALNALLRTHRPHIYRLALRMVVDSDDAADITQDILVKLTTRLAQYQGRSAFRTWLYRIVVNHLRDMPTRRSELRMSQLPSVAATPLADTPVPEEAVTETRRLCALGMLLCLDRTQRLAYLLGELYRLPAPFAARLLDIQPTNFRQRLHRARTDLRMFAAGRCGLINPANPCRCPAKTRQWLQLGIVDGVQPRFNPRYQDTVTAYVEAVADEGLQTVLTRYRAMTAFAEHENLNDRLVDAEVKDLLRL